jgi:ribonuclease D
LTTDLFVKVRKPILYENDLPEDQLKYYLAQSYVAVDTETRGLNIVRDRLCLVQICDEEGVVSLVRFKDENEFPRLANTNLKCLLEAPKVMKVFHFARFDVAVLKHYLNADVSPIWCTKIASKLVRTYTERHGLKDLAKELLGLEVDKSDQTSDWARTDLSASQLEYAANDVRVLVPIYKKMKEFLERENRLALASKLFAALPAVCETDLGGWRDIFEH